MTIYPFKCAAHIASIRLASGVDRKVWQMSSSNDDLVHAATLRVKGTTTTFLGCMVYQERARQLVYYPKAGTLTNVRLIEAGAFLLSLSNSMDRV